MKKFNVFLLILLVVSCFFAINNTPALAEETYTINIFTVANYNTEKTNLEKYLFYADYLNNEEIIFEASLYNGQDAVDTTGFTYSWQDVTDENNPVALSSTNVLELSKIYSDNGSHIIYVGTKHYKITISGSGVECSQILTVDITDTSNQIIVTKISTALGVNESGAYLIDKDTEAFQISSILSKLKVDSTTNWYLKTPNSSEYKLIHSGTTCPINPSNLVTSTNGFGEYKLYAGAQSSSILYTSQMIIFKATAGELNSELNYHITRKVINNTKAEVEAFTFTLENASADGIDFSKIIWYVNNAKLGKGETFTYEPTNNETFVVDAKYQGASLTQLATLETTPKSTGTLKMILIVAGAVVVISVIFAITVRAFNKRRDNVW